jgi:hypothetical protein
VSFPIRNEQFFARSRKSRNYAEAYEEYAAQGIPKLDTEIAASTSESLRLVEKRAISGWKLAKIWEWVSYILGLRPVW